MLTENIIKQCVLGAMREFEMEHGSSGNEDVDIMHACIANMRDEIQALKARIAVLESICLRGKEKTWSDKTWSDYTATNRTDLNARYFR